MMMVAAMLPHKGRRWGNPADNDSEEEVVEVRWRQRQDRRGVGRWWQAKGRVCV